MYWSLSQTKGKNCERGKIEERETSELDSVPKNVHWFFVQMPGTIEDYIFLSKMSCA